MLAAMTGRSAVGEQIVASNPGDNRDRDRVEIDHALSESIATGDGICDAQNDQKDLDTAGYDLIHP